MFQKLVELIPYSPAITSQVTFYARRLRKEEFTRRLGLIFVGLAVVLQGFILISPPEASVLASPGNDIIAGGVGADSSTTTETARQRVIHAMQTNSLTREVYAAYGITEADVQRANKQFIRTSNQSYRSVGQQAFGRGNESCARTSPSNHQYCERSMHSAYNYRDQEVAALVGTNSQGQWFAILFSCGNPVTGGQVPQIPQPVAGFFDAVVDCETVNGWAYDPRRSSASIPVQIYIDGSREATISANRPRQDVNNVVGISGNHGFVWSIPERFKDGQSHKVEIYGIEDASARGVSEGNQLLTGSPKRFTCDKPAPPAEQLVVCDISTNRIITISETDFDDRIHQTESQCEELQVCINDTITTIHRHEYNDEALRCPKVQVCRDGVVVTITTDQRVGSDVAESQCTEIQVCRDHQLVTVQKFEVNNNDQTPDPETECDFITMSKRASNLTQGIDAADGTTANPGDFIEYQLITANHGELDETIAIDEDMADVLEYARITDPGGGNLNQDNHLIWNDVVVPADGSITKTVQVQILNPIPTTPESVSNPQSYNLVLSNVYGDTIEINVPCPPSKCIEQSVKSLPKTGPGANIVVGFSAITLSGYFYSRNRLLSKELKLIRQMYS